MTRSNEVMYVRPLPSVTQAEYRGGYRIHVTFRDGVAGIVDFEPWLSGPVFEPVKRTVAWPNGADIAPETIYERLRSNEAA